MSYPQFHALWGLSVLKKETTPPAYNELMNYYGPSDILRQLFNNELENTKIDIAFIDSRKGTALAEFHVLRKHLSNNGVIYCHDVLNKGKGEEVLNYLTNNNNKYKFTIKKTGTEGILIIQNLKQNK